MVLVPLLVLALWQVAVELERGRIGMSLVLAIVHLLLIWVLLHLGTRVERRVELSNTTLVLHPVIGSRRELAWGEITRIDDVKYLGPGVSGLYLYGSTGGPAVLDVWLPGWFALRQAVREHASQATWDDRYYGWLVTTATA